MRKTNTLSLCHPSKLDYFSNISFSLSYQAVASWNLLQQYINIDDLSTLSLKKLKYLAKFYFLSSYI